MNPKCSWIDVTPAKAQKWLRDANTHNRRQGDVSSYARDMREGRWQETHEPIAFSDDGVLIDGQHRLAAIVASGATVRMLVVRGTQMETQGVIDCGRSRSLADRIKLGRGEDVTQREIAVARLMMYPLRKAKFSGTEVAEFLSAHRDAISFACGTMKAHRRGVCIAGTFAVMARAWYTQDRPRIAEFGEVLYTGLPHTPKADAAAILLRNMLVDARNLNGGTNAAAIYGKIQGAMKSFLSREHVTRLCSIQGEQFPLPEEMPESATASLHSIRAKRVATASQNGHAKVA